VPPPRWIIADDDDELARFPPTDASFLLFPKTRTSLASGKEEKREKEREREREREDPD
jgi:hypothetical protein